MHALVRIVAVLLLMVQSQVVYQRGDVVRVKSEAESRMVTVVALPGDRVRIDDTGVYVNGALVTWISPELLARLAKPWDPEIIPVDHYFVAGEQRTDVAGRVSVSRYWALTGAENLERVR